jgi:hypothetical protein
MFIKHLKIMSNKDDLVLSVSILLMVMIFDYIIIDNHPNLLDIDKEHFSKIDIDDDVSDKDIEEILNTYDESEMQEVLDDTEKINYPNKKAFYQLPSDNAKPSYDLDMDCYRRGDGRGNTEKVQNYYANEIL